MSLTVPSVEDCPCSDCPFKAECDTPCHALKLWAVDVDWLPLVIRGDLKRENIVLLK
jgi:hypothetical protein